MSFIWPGEVKALYRTFKKEIKELLEKNNFDDAIKKTQTIEDRFLYLSIRMSGSIEGDKLIILNVIIYRFKESLYRKNKKLSNEKLMLVNEYYLNQNAEEI